LIKNAWLTTLQKDKHVLILNFKDLFIAVFDIANLFKDYKLLSDLGVSVVEPLFSQPVPFVADYKVHSVLLTSEKNKDDSMILGEHRICAIIQAQRETIANKIVVYNILLQSSK